MADISNINLPNGENYDIKDKVARNDIAINRTTLGTQCKNLLKNNAATKTVNGVTFTVNDDKSITVNGTATSAGVYAVIGGADVIAGNRYIISGGAGNGGTYGLYTENFGTVQNYGSDSIYVPNTTGKAVFRIFVRPGVTVSNVTFYPMLRYADITDSTYEPYKESVDERLIKNKSDIAVNKSTLGYQRKNILDETGYLSSITSVTRGTKSISGNQITLTATAADCYTKPSADSDGGFRIPVYPNTEYILSWESDNSNQGAVYVFMNGSTSSYKAANNNRSKRLKFTTNSDTTFVTIRLGVLVSGESIAYSNIMLRYADITDDTYEAYKESVDERLIENKSNAAVNRSTLGYQCKNLLKNTAKTSTMSGVTFTVNTDKSVTANGTNSTSNYANIIVFKGELEGGTYTLTGAVSDVFRIRLGMGTSADGYGAYVGLDKGNGYTFTVAEKALYTVTCQVESGKTASNVIFKPMLRYADIMDDTYEPYQPSVQEQVPYSISLPSKSTSESYSYNGVPTMICLTPSESVSSGGGLYLINSVGTAVYLIDKTGIVVNTNTTNQTFTITNNTASTYDVYISCAYKKE